MHVHTVGETSHPRRRRRKTSEGSSAGGGGGEGRQQLATCTKDLTTTMTTSSQSATKDADSSRTEGTQKASSTVEEVHSVADDSTQGSTSVPPSVTQIESGPSEGASGKEQTATSEKSMEEVQSVRSSAGQLQSSADSQLSTLGMFLTRGNSVATGSGKTVPKIKKKVAPKVVPSRPRRTPRPSAAGTGKYNVECKHVVLKIFYFGKINSAVFNFRGLMTFAYTCRLVYE